MANEYDEPLTDFIDWRKVADMLIRGDIIPQFKEYATGAFMTIDIDIVED